MPTTDAAIERYARLAEESQQPFLLCLDLGFRAMRALLRGCFTDSERLAQQALAIGQRLQTENAAGIFGLQMFTLRREQGRLKELEPAVRYFVQQHTVAGTWRPGLAVIYSELGRTEEARAEFEHLAQHDFADLPRDALWMGCMSYLADVCTFLGDKNRAAILYELLLPYAGRTVVVGSAVACYGALSRYLGALSYHARALGRGGAALRRCPRHERPHGRAAMACPHTRAVRHHAPRTPPAGRSRQGCGAARRGSCHGPRAGNARGRGARHRRDRADEAQPTLAAPTPRGDSRALEARVRPFRQRAEAEAGSQKTSSGQFARPADQAPRAGVNSSGAPGVSRDSPSSIVTSAGMFSFRATSRIASGLGASYRQ